MCSDIDEPSSVLPGSFISTRLVTSMIIAVELWSEHADNLIDLVGRHGEDHELRVLDRILGGVGRMGVRRLRRLPSFLWRALGESHLVPRLGRRFRQRLTYIPRADDRNFHSIPPPTCIRRCANRTRIDEAAMLTTTAPTSPELTCGVISLAPRAIAPST